MNVFLTADFGSTFTKLSAIDMDAREIVACAKSFTTIGTNVMGGYNDALQDIYGQCGKIDFAKRLASSSAAGGLRMISVGLVPNLTAKASKLASASAGAKVLGTFSFELAPEDREKIAELSPDILLLSGGIDGGNKEVILHNARMIAAIGKQFAVIVAGNRTVSREVAATIEASGKRVVVCENVMPVFGKLNIEPAREAIRSLFIENIISAKGLDGAQALMDAEIVPTPLAVYNALELLSRGSGVQTGLGELMGYDIGGATTDVYSMSSGIPTRQNVFMQGLSEPFAKRTVEGDIGMRYSVSSLIDAAGSQGLAFAANTAGVSEGEITIWAECCTRTPGVVPEADDHCKRIDEALASLAVKISAERHCGFTEIAFTSSGEMILQTGKDLTGVKYIVGSGGVIASSANPGAILQNALYSPRDLNLLKPAGAKLLLDRKNILAAMGLIGSVEPEAAVEIMKKEITEI